VNRFSEQSVLSIPASHSLIHVPLPVFAPSYFFDPNLVDRDGGTPLLYATANRHKTIVELLLKIGKVDPSARALLLAIEYGDEEIVELLQQYGAKESP
jgi:ankyrin repeat protein